MKCELCGKNKEEGKKFNKHHISYEKDITINLCYTCHSLVHCRLKFGNPFEKKYGKDLGFYKLSKKFIKIYEKRMK